MPSSVGRGQTKQQVPVQEEGTGIGTPGSIFRVVGRWEG